MSRWRLCGCRQALLLLAMTALAVCDTYYPDKRTESRPFVLGSRYGRSGPPAPLHLAPRNDRFFMGSRYGKRSGDAAEAAAAGEETLACRYTGLRGLYRCAPAPAQSPDAAAPPAARSGETNDITDEIISDDFKELE